MSLIRAVTAGTLVGAVAALRRTPRGPETGRAPACPAAPTVRAGPDPDRHPARRLHAARRSAREGLRGVDETGAPGTARRGGLARRR